MRARWLTVWLCLLFLILPWPAQGWDTKGRGGGLSVADWRSIYEKIPGVKNGRLGLNGNEHAEISAHALLAIGAGKLLDTKDLPVVIDLNASLFRRSLLFGRQPWQPADAPKDGLERRVLPPLAQFSGLPDFSYAMFDWINKNVLCPLPKQAPQRNKCHDYSVWIGAALNSSHFGTQAALNYQRLHRVALWLASRAARLRRKLEQTPHAAQAYRAWLVEAEWMALAYEGIAQHFLADRWSTGHMWERWNGGDYRQLGSKNLLANTLTGIIAGLFHGIQSALHGKIILGRGLVHHLWPDPLSSPVVEVQRLDGVITRSWNYFVHGESPRIRLRAIYPMIYRHAGGGPGRQGIGDYGFTDMLRGRFGGRKYGFVNDVALNLPAQKRTMLDCVKGGWADVIRALGRNGEKGYGILAIPLRADAPSIKTMGKQCFDIYVTNRSMMLAWPFSQPTFWSQVGRATLTVFSDKRTLKVLEAMVARRPIAGQLLDALKRAYGRQLETGRRAARNMVRLSYLAWRYGRQQPGGIDLARGGLGALDFSGRKGPSIDNSDVIEPGNRYGAAGYFPKDDLAGLPERDRLTGRDKQSVYGFFSRATAYYWARRLPKLLAPLRGAKEPWKQALCGYLADMAYNGTTPGYMGKRREQRTLDHRAGSPVVPSYFSALGIQLDPARLPVHLPPGYVAEPQARSRNGLAYRSVQAWCARVPVLYLAKKPEWRDRDIVAEVTNPLQDVVLKGADLGSARGKVWVSCEAGEDKRPLIVRQWRSDQIVVRIPPRLYRGVHSLCLQRADGVAAIGPYRLLLRPGNPQVIRVTISNREEILYQQPGNIDKPLGAGSYRLEIEFDQPMEQLAQMEVFIKGPARLKLIRRQWLSARRWEAWLEIPGDKGRVSTGYQGRYQLSIMAQSSAGRSVDAEPKLPGNQPDTRHRFRVGGARISSAYVGCYHNPADDHAALQVLPNGQALVLLDDRKQRYPMRADVSPKGELILRHDLTPETFRWFYQRYHGKWTGWYRKPNMAACNFYMKSRPFFECGGPEKHRDYISIRGSYLRWTLGQQRLGHSVQNRARKFDRIRFSDYLKTREGFSPLASVANRENLNVIRRSLGGAVLGNIRGADRSQLRIRHLQTFFIPMLVERGARVQRLQLLDDRGQIISRDVAGGTSYRIRATGTSHCPGIREWVSVDVYPPGEFKPVKVKLKETGPDTGIFEGPEQPMRASLAQGMRTGTLRVVASKELRRRLGLGGISFNYDPAYRKRAGGASLSVRVSGTGREPSPGPVTRWRVYQLDARRAAGRSLPDLSVIETRFESDGQTATLTRTRYPVSLAKGPATPDVLWHINWRSGKLISQTTASDARGLVHLNQRAGTLRQSGFVLQQLPDRIRQAVGGEARPLRPDWQSRPVKKSAAYSQKTGKPGKRFSYQGPPYQAIMIIRVRGTRQTIRYRIAEMPGRRRMEILMPKGYGHRAKFITILREDLGLGWTLHPYTHTYTETRLTSPPRELVYEGEENVNGMRLKRYSYRVRKKASEQYGKVWKNEKGIMVRSIVTLKMTGFSQTQEILVKDIRIGPLNDKLFEIPSGYTPASR